MSFDGVKGADSGWSARSGNGKIVTLNSVNRRLKCSKVPDAQRVRCYFAAAFRSIVFPKTSTNQIQRMKTINKILFGAFALFFLASCSNQLSYFTKDVYEDYRWEEDDLKKIQFYLSRDIRLRRNFEGGSAEVVDGKIIVENGRQVEEVVIPKGTPGVFIFSPKKDRFAVSFEDSDDRYLVFGPNPKFNDRYVLLASEWNRNNGIVTYAGKKWRVSTEEAYAALLVDLRKLDKITVNKHVAKGRRVD